MNRSILVKTAWVWKKVPLNFKQFWTKDYSWPTSVELLRLLPVNGPGFATQPFLPGTSDISSLSFWLLLFLFFSPVLSFFGILFFVNLCTIRPKNSESVMKNSALSSNLQVTGYGKLIQISSIPIPVHRLRIYLALRHQTSLVDQFLTSCPRITKIQFGRELLIYSKVKSTFLLLKTHMSITEVTLS